MVSALSTLALSPRPSLPFRVWASSAPALSTLAPALAQLLSVSLPDEDPAYLLHAVSATPATATLALFSADSASPLAAPLALALLRRSARLTHLIALATDPAHRSRGVGGFLLDLVRSISSGGLLASIESPPSSFDPTSPPRDDTERRAIFYLRHSAQILTPRPAWDSGALELWLPPLSRAALLSPPPPL